MESDPKEIELKLRIAPEDIAILQNHPSLASAFHSPTHEQLDSVYFDSDDRALRDHGLTLRVRQIGDKRVQTIKALNQGSYSIERSEWEQLIKGNLPELTNVEHTPLAPVLTDDVRNTLKPVFETRIERTAYRLNGDDSAIAMAVDQGRIVAFDSSCPVSEIELELKRGNPIELFKVARAISDIVPAWLDVKSKSERGYDLVEQASVAAEKARDPDLSPDTSVGRAFILICRACLRHLVANEPALTKRNAEALHQMRIAVRRLRAAISLFSDVVNDDRVTSIKTELRWFARELGPARDLDAFLLEVLNPLKKHYQSEPGLVSISKMFARQRLQGYRRAQDAVHSARFRVLVLDTAEWVEAGPWSVSHDPLIRMPPRNADRDLRCRGTFTAAEENQTARSNDRSSQRGRAAPLAHSGQKGAVCCRILFQCVRREESLRSGVRKSCHCFGNCRIASADLMTSRHARHCARTLLPGLVAV